MVGSRQRAVDELEHENARLARDLNATVRICEEMQAWRDEYVQRMEGEGEEESNYWDYEEWGEEQDLEVVC